MPSWNHLCALLAELLWEGKNPTGRVSTPGCLLLASLLLRWLLSSSCFDQWCGGRGCFSIRIATQFSILNYARSSRCLIVLFVHAQEHMKLFDPICGHKEHQFTGLAATIGNGEEFRLGDGGCTRRASPWAAAGARETAAASCAACASCRHLSSVGGLLWSPSSNQLSPISGALQPAP